MGYRSLESAVRTRRAPLEDYPIDEFVSPGEDLSGKSPSELRGLVLSDALLRTSIGVIVAALRGTMPDRQALEAAKFVLLHAMGRPPYGTVPMGRIDGWLERLRDVSEDADFIEELEVSGGGEEESVGGGVPSPPLQP